MQPIFGVSANAGLRCRTVILLQQSTADLKRWKEPPLRRSHTYRLHITAKAHPERRPFADYPSGKVYKSALNTKKVLCVVVALSFIQDHGDL